MVESTIGVEDSTASPTGGAWQANEMTGWDFTSGDREALRGTTGNSVEKQKGAPDTDSFGCRGFAGFP